MAIRRATWTCSSCGKVNSGAEIRCSCGNPREDKERPQFSDSDPVVTDEQELARAAAGPHITCGHCQTNNLRGETHCVSCGNEINSQDKDRPVEKVVVVTGQTAANFPSQDENSTTPRSYSEGPGVNDGRKGSNPSGQSSEINLPINGSYLLNSERKWRAWFWLFPIALLIWAAWYFLLSTHTELGIVTAASWSRSIPIEKLVTVTEEGWNVPSGGRVLSSQEKQRTTRQVFVEVKHEKCTVRGTPKDLGNGYYDDGVREEDCPKNIYRDEPVMDTWYEYEVDTWKYQRSANASEQGDNPYWPESSLGYKEREGHRTATYKLKIAGVSDTNPRRFEYTTSDFTVWKSFQPSTPVTLQVNRIGGVLSISKR